MMRFRLAVTRFGALTLFVGVLWAGLALSVPAAQAQAVRIGGAGAVQGLLPLLAEAYRAGRPDAQFDLVPHSLGSMGGIKALLGGALDIAVSGRQLKDDETSGGIVAAPFGTTALVFASSMQEAPLALSSAQVLAIYRLETKDWPDGTPIRVILRPESEPENAVLIRQFDGMDDALRRLRELNSIPIAMTEQDNLTLIERTPGSLAPASLVAIRAEDRDVRVVELDGVMPTLETLADGTYPMVRPLYFVTRPDAPQAVRDFIAFVQSGAGAAVLTKYGVLPASP